MSPSTPRLPGAKTLAFFDESGGLDTGHFVLGGYVGSSKMWRDFSSDWQNVLNEAPALPAFHAVDFERGQNGFEVLISKKMKAERMRQLVGVVERHRPQGVLIILGMDDFRGRIPPRLRGNLKKQGWKYPYQICAAYIVGSLSDLHEEIGEDLGVIDVVFDWMEQLHVSTSRLIEQSVRDAIAEESRKHADRIGDVHWPKPAERAAFVPLQAADLLVWHKRRALDEPDGRNRRAHRDLMRCPVKYIGARSGFDAIDDWVRGHAARPTV